MADAFVRTCLACFFDSFLRALFVGTAKTRHGMAWHNMPAFFDSEELRVCFWEMTRPRLFRFVRAAQQKQGRKLTELNRTGMDSIIRFWFRMCACVLQCCSRSDCVLSGMNVSAFYSSCIHTSVLNRIESNRPLSVTYLSSLSLPNRTTLVVFKSKLNESSRIGR